MNKPEPQPEPTPQPQPTPDLPEDPILVLLDLHNQARAQHNAKPLRLSMELVVAATKHAEWMARNAKMSHTGEGGNSVADRAEAAGYNSRMVGENIAYGPAAPAAVHAMWMNSTGHRRNILRADYDEVGFAVAFSPRKTPYWCTVLARSAANQEPWADANVGNPADLEPIGLIGPVGLEQEWVKP